MRMRGFEPGAQSHPVGRWCDKPCAVPASDGYGCPADAKTRAQARDRSLHATRYAAFRGCIDAARRCILWSNTASSGAQRCQPQ